MVDDKELHQTRNVQWFALAAFSNVALASMTSNFANDLSDETKEVKWVVSGVSVALALSTLSFIAHFVLKEKFVGTIMEGGLAFLTVGFWAAVIPTIMHPEHELAVVTRAGGLLNPNLYYSSWAAFFTSVFVFFGFMWQHHGDWVGRNDDRKQCSFSMWAGLVATSVVVMSSSGRLYDESECNDLTDSDTCNRIKAGISLGVISAFFPVVWMFASSRFVKGRMGTLVDSLLVLLLMVLWTFGIAWLTFDKEKSPATSPGNLYYFTWGSWVLTVIMTLRSLQRLVDCEKATTEGQVTESKDKDTNEAVVEEDLETNVEEA